MSNVREKSDTLFGNVAFISNHIDDIIIMTYQMVLGAKRKKER